MVWILNGTRVTMMDIENMRIRMDQNLEGQHFITGSILGHMKRMSSGGSVKTDAMTMSKQWAI